MENAAVQVPGAACLLQGRTAIGSMVRRVAGGATCFTGGLPLGCRWLPDAVAGASLLSPPDPPVALAASSLWSASAVAVRVMSVVLQPSSLLIRLIQGRGISVKALWRHKPIGPVMRLRGARA